MFTFLISFIELLRAQGVTRNWRRATTFICGKNTGSAWKKKSINLFQIAMLFVWPQKKFLLELTQVEQQKQKEALEEEYERRLEKGQSVVCN